MKHMDGYELLKNVRKDNKYDAIPIIFLSAKSPCVDPIKVLIDAADDYIVKPFDMEELVDSIRSLLQRSKYLS